MPFLSVPSVLSVCLSMTILIWYYLLLHYFNVTLFKINVINTAFFPYCTINAALLMLHHSITLFHVKQFDIEIFDVALFSAAFYCWSIFFYHILHYTDIQNKNIYNHQVLLYISSTWKKGEKTKTIWNRSNNNNKNTYIRHDQ